MKKKLLISILSFLFAFIALPEKNFAQAPVNDDCENAIELVLGVNSCSSPVNGTTENASQSITPSNPSCDYIGGVDDDVWYKFTAPNSGFVNLSFSNIAGGGPSDNLSATVYGGDCNNLVEVSCNQYAGYLTYLRVTLGTTYYLRLYSYANDPGIHKSFTLCAYMVNNDECINAKELTVGTILTRDYYNQYGTTDGATESASTPLPSCSDGYNDDVWYKFTAASTENIHVRFQLSSGYYSGSVSAQVYSGPCNSLTAVDCKSTVGYNPSYININAVAGTDYYIRVFSTDTNPSVAYDFFITAYTLTPAPVNDDCDNAVELSLGEGSCSGGAYGYSTLGATPSANTPAPSCDAAGTGDDIWFKFSSTDARAIRIELQNSYYAGGNNTGITGQLYSGSCNGLVPVSCNSYLGYTYSNAENFSFELNADAATEYYLRIFTPDADPTQYAILNVCAYYLPPPPNNDECEGAILLPAVISTQCTSPTNGTTIGANGSSMPGCLGVIVDDDVWYKFIATASSHIITVTPAIVNGIQEYTAYQLFSGTCNTLAELNCIVSVTPSGPAQQKFSNLTIGETYYVRVYSFYNTYSYKGDFSICITTPNDECDVAETLTVNPTSTCTVISHGSTIEATQSSQWNFDCSGSYDDDVWYKFTATAVSHKISVTPAATNGITDVVFQIYSGDCSSFNQLECVNNTAGTDMEEITLNGLTVGEAYYVRLYSNSADYSARGDFDICVRSLFDNQFTQILYNPSFELPVLPDLGNHILSSVPGWTYDSWLQPNLIRVDGSGYGSGPDIAHHGDQYMELTGGNGYISQVFNISTEAMVNFGGWFSRRESSASGFDSYVEILDANTNNVLSTSATVSFTCCEDQEVWKESSGSITLLSGSYVFRVYLDDYANVDDAYVNIPTVVSNIPNDECTGAISLIVNSDETCTFTTLGNTAEATGSMPGCFITPDDDIWYQFVATASDQKIKVTPSATNGIWNAAFEVFSGTCSSLISIDCVNGGSGGADPKEKILTGLTIGETYYVRVYSYFDFVDNRGAFEICVNTPTINIPSNDECSGAIPLTVSSTPDCTNPVNGTTLFATVSAAPDCNTNNPDDDVWYSFVALGTSQLITINSANPGGIVNAAMQFYSGTCNSLTSLGCIGCPNCGGFLYTLQTIPGNTYYIRVYSEANGTGQGDFNICVSSYAPLNDDCVGAVNVPVNNDNTCTLSTNGTTVHATSSGQYGACLNGTADDDVWLNFIATANAHQITVAPEVTGGITDAVVEVYGGSCSSGLSYIICANNTTGNGVETFIAQGLTAGATYYMRVYSAANGPSYQGAFSVCIKNTVVNDNCSGAITIPVNDDGVCTNTYEGTTVEASDLLLPLQVCSALHDVWYKFVAGSTAYSINVTPAAVGGINGVTWGLFSGDCNNLTRLGCTSIAATFEDLVIGNTYYLQVANTQYNTAFQGAFTICIKSIDPAVPNDICSGAIDVPISNDINCVTNVTGTTTGAGISLATGLKDVWYKFTATESAHKIKVSPVADSLKNIAFQVYSGNCVSLTSIASVNNYNDPGFNYNSFDTTKPETQSIENLTIGDTYFIRVFGDGVYRNNSLVYPDGSFNICVSLSGNDVCTFARTLTVNPGADCNYNMEDSTDYSTPSTDIAYGNNCGVVNYINDSWFKFTALDTAQLLTVFELSGYLSGWQLFSGSCGTLNSMACVSGYATRQILSGLTIGQTYYLRVYSGLSVTRCKFSICVSALAINNECNGAFELPVNTTPGCTLITNGSTRGSTHSSVNVPYSYYCESFYSCGFFGCSLLVGNDVWYKFVAASTQQRVTVTGTSLGLNLFFTVYSGDCNSLSTIVCVNDYNPLSGSVDEEAVALDNLIIGNTYYVRVYNQAGLTAVGDFGICVGTIEPVNDLCSNAITVPVNIGNNCNLSVTGSNTSATRSYDAPKWPGYVNTNSFCNPVGNADVFYKFVATSNTHLITVTPTAIGGIDDVMFQVYSGNCGSLSFMAEINSTAYDKPETISLGNFVPGNTYYIRVANSNGELATRGSFAVCVSAPLLNDECAGAITLAVNSTSSCTLQTTGTTIGATPANGSEDVWYKFMATQAQHMITITSITLNNPVFTLFTGECNNLQQVREEIDHDAAGPGVEFQSYDSLTVGNTYYIRVRSRQPGYGDCFRYAAYNLTGTFSICVSAPALLNDLIDEAINVPVNNDMSCTAIVTGTNAGSSYSDNYSECYRTHMNFDPSVSDVWYKFTATATSHIITISPTATGSISEVNYSVFERVTQGAEGLQQRGCVNLVGGNAAETQSFNGLIIGRVYYIRIMASIYTNLQGAFTVCITTPVLPADNSKIITFAGGGTGEGASAANSQLFKPTDVTVDGMGNVYIADAGYIKKINKADGVMSIVAGNGVSGSSGDGGPATSAQIPFSCKIAADKFGNIFIGDYDRSAGKLRKINSSGIITTIYTLPQDPFPCFGDFCTGPIYHIRAITGITTDVSGNIYFTVNRDENHNGDLWNWLNVYKLTPSGSLTELANSGQYGYGTTVDAAGNVYFIQDLYDPYYNNVSYRYIKKIDGTTHALTTVGGTQYFGYTGDGADATKANIKPADVKADAAGNLYIADGNGYWYGEYGNYSIRKIGTDGIISTVAGTSVNDYAGDNGPATLAAMHTPVAIAVDSSGDIYIADVKENEYPVTTANRIRKIITSCSGGIAMSNMGNTFYVNSEKVIYKDCDTIAKLTAVSPVVFNKDITAKVWIESTVPLYDNFPYVSRHYEINPLTDPSATNTRITLYFTQQEFTDYNVVIGAGNKLPIDGMDAGNFKTNLRIIQWNGISGNGTGLQSTYTGTSSTINPDDNDIVWNSSENRWEITFTASGSNGFFVQTPPVFTTLDLKLFLEGYYRGNSTMEATLYNLELSTDPTVTDFITVNLWDPAHTDINTYPYPDYTATAFLHTDGIASLQFPSAVIDHSFYIAVKHRNSIETWSKLPVMFTGNTIYDFSTGLDKAYDDAVIAPMKMVGEVIYGFYTGDINQDGAIDGQDMNVIDNEVGFFGYNVSDVNGDGATDGQDMNFVDNNSQLGLFFARPY